MRSFVNPSLLWFPQTLLAAGVQRHYHRALVSAFLDVSNDPSDALDLCGEVGLRRAGHRDDEDD